MISDKAGQTTGALTLIRSVGIDLGTGIKYLVLHKKMVTFIIYCTLPMPFSVQSHSSITQFKHLVVFFAEHLLQFQTLEQSIHLIIF